MSNAPVGVQFLPTFMKMGGKGATLKTQYLENQEEWPSESQLQAMCKAGL